VFKPLSAEVGKQIVHVHDIGRELLQFCKWGTASAGCNPYSSAQRVSMLLLQDVGVCGHHGDIVPCRSQRIGLILYSCVFSARLL
jgi:hypothetical protein